MAQRCFEVGMTKDSPPKRRRDAVHSQIIVCGPNTTCGKNIVVRTGIPPDFIGDEVEFIGNDGNLPDVYAQIT